MNNLVTRYTQFLLRTVVPTKTWLALRFVLHWLTLPIKLLVIGTLGIYQIIAKSFVRTREIPLLPDLATKKAYFGKIYGGLPVWETESFKTYVTRVPFPYTADGTNHNPDHQCLRQGTYAFVMNRLGKLEDKMLSGLTKHVQSKWLCRGYKLNPYEQEMQYNAGTVSGDMLIGMSLALSTVPREDSNWSSFELFDRLIATIIENDYALLEGSMPEVGDPGRAVWDELYLKNGKRPELVTMKSERGMWQPGLETAGAQALTILAALRVAQKRNGNREAAAHYKKLLWKYGYGLLSLFPTAYIDSKRGYFNEHNCISALFVLSKLSDNRLGRLFWKIPMVYVWLLSRHWYNGYFTGLLNAAHPGTVGQGYVDKCIALLYSREPNLYHPTETNSIKLNYQPADYNTLNADEFTPEVPQNEGWEMSDPLGSKQVRTGLGFVATAIMLEKDPKSLL